MSPDSISTYLSDCHARLRDAQRGHYIASDYYRRLHYGIGVPLIVATTVVSSSFLVDTASAKSLAIAFSVVATILAALQTFLRPDERSERHRAAATAYGALKREAEVALLVPADEAPDLVRTIVGKWESVAGTAPVTPQSVRRKVRGVSVAPAPPKPADS